jgi:recombination protein RecA
MSENISSALHDIIKSVVDDLKEDYGTSIGSDPSTTDFVDPISSGIVPLDILFGGGLFSGRFYEFSGEESSGKSTLSYHYIAQAQKSGWVVSIVESENAIDKGRAKIIGVNFNDILESPANTLETQFSVIAKTIYKLYESAPNLKVLVVWDTLAIAPTAAEYEALKKGEKPSQAMAEKAKLIHFFVRAATPMLEKTKATILVINQVYETLGGYNSSYESPGGMALKHAASAHLRLTRKGWRYRSDDTIMGAYNEMSLFAKSKQSPPDKIRGTINFDSGYDEYDMLLDYVQSRKILESTKNGWIYIKGNDGNVIESVRTTNFESKLRESPELKTLIEYKCYLDRFNSYKSLQERFLPILNQYEEKLNLPKTVINQ